MALKVLEKDGFYGWVNLIVIFIFNLASGLSMITFGLFLPFWVKEFGWDRGWLSLAQSLGMVISGLAAPIVGLLIMKYGAKRNIIAGNIIIVAGMFWLSYMSRMWELYLGFGVFIGIGFSIGGMLAMMTVVNNWFVMKRSIALSISYSSMGVGGVVLIPTLMHLITTIGWRTTYQILSVAIFVCCVIIPGLFLKSDPSDLGQVPDGPASEKQKTPDRAPIHGSALAKELYRTPVDFTAKEAMRTTTLWFLVGYITLQMLAMMAIMTYQVDYLFDIGISPQMAGRAGGLMSGIMAIAQLGVGFLGLRYNMRTLAVYSTAIVITGFTILLFAKTFPMVLLYSVFIGAGFGIQAIANGALLPNYFGMKEFPKIMGFTMPFGTLIGSVGAPAAGKIREITGTYIPAFQICLGILVVAFFCILFAKPPMHPSLKESEPATV